MVQRDAVTLTPPPPKTMPLTMKMKDID
jgi:hypothetical protein